MPKWYDIFKAEAGCDTTKVALYDEIGAYGKTAKDFLADIEAIKTGHIDLHINSYGGEILDGLACYNAIKNHKAEVTTHIDGIAASIASVIALAGDKVCIAKNAFLMIHNGWCMAIGDPAEMRKQADVLDKLCGSIAQVYADKTGKPIEEIRKAMDDETWFDASEAKEWGMVDEISDKGDEGPMAASAMLAVAKYAKVPPKLRKFAAKAAKNNVVQQKGTTMKTVKFKAGVSNSAEIPCPHCNEAINVELETPPDAEVEAKAKAAADKAREEGKAEGAKAEREYRAMFSTVVAAAKMDAATAAEFEKEFYGRNEADLKFLASHAIGNRAKAIGEQAAGNGEGENNAKAKAEKEIEDNAVKRFNTNPEIRRMFGLPMSIGETDASYQAALKRYVAREKQWAEDQAKHGTSVAK